ncbi:MAG: Glutamate racemase [Chloroflexi bacterium]|nr:Glutamate racemase [Chloroflexota bacterium]
MADPRPIGVFDSGVGGLTVLREILRRSPAESTIYLGDNARAPYGIRPDGEVRAFSVESIDLLVERDVKAIVVACNTSTAVAIGDLRRRYDLPVLGVIRPGAVTASLTTRNRRVGVIAVAAALAPLLGERDTAGEFIFPLPPSARIDTLLLGCTHYPLLRGAIAAVAGEGIAIVDSASATASALAELLTINGLEAPADGAGNEGASRNGSASSGRDAGAAVHLQLTTGDVTAFRAIAGRMFGDAFADVSGVEVRPAVMTSRLGR